MGGGVCDARAVARLAAIDDYERRALSRRKFAIRAFDAAAARSRRAGFGETNPRCSPATVAGIGGAAVHAGGEGATSCAGGDFAPTGGPAYTARRNNAVLPRSAAAEGGQHDEIQRADAADVPPQVHGRHRRRRRRARVQPGRARPAGADARADQARQPQFLHRRDRLCGREQPQRHEPVLRQRRLDRGRPQDRDHQGGRPVQSAGRAAEGQEAGRKRQGRHDRRRPGQQRRARGAQLRQAAEGVLHRLRRRHRRHHLGSLSLSVPHLDLGLPAQHADGELGLRQSRQGDRHHRLRLCRRPRRHRAVQGALCRARRQGAQGDLAAARHHRFQPVPDRHQVDQSAGHLRLHAGRRRHPLHPAVHRVRIEGEDAADRLHHHRLAHHQCARQGRARGDLRHHLYRHRRQSAEQAVRDRLPGQVQGAAGHLLGLRLCRGARASTRR